MEMAGRRTHGTTRQRPLDVFRQIEQAALLPLPTVAYDLGVWRQCKLHPDCHVVVDGAYYSAPHRLIGKTLWVRSNGASVQIFHEHQRLATHTWGTARHPPHLPGPLPAGQGRLPDGHPALLPRPGRAHRPGLRRPGRANCSASARWIACAPSQAVLRLADKFGDQRLERACARALYFGETSPRTLRRILDHGLENEPLPGLPQPAPQIDVHVRAPRVRDLPRQRRSRPWITSPS